MSFWVDRGDRPKLIQGVKAFYLNAMLRGLVYSLIGVFTPIFVFQRVSQFVGIKEAIFAVIVYYLILRGTVFVAAIGASHLIERLGFRRSITISMIIYAINIVALAAAERYLFLLIPAAVLAGLSLPFYWIARHSAIAQDTSNVDLGKEMSIVKMGEAFASFAAPAIGGFVIVNFSYMTLYLLAGLILILSIIPLWFMPRHNHKNGSSFGGWMRFLHSREYWHQTCGTVGIVGYDYGLFIVWPLVMYILGLNVEVVGVLFTLSALVGIVMRAVVGRLFDRLRARGGYYDERVFAFAAILLALSLAVRAWVSSTQQIVILEILTAMCGVVYGLFWTNYFHLGGKRMGSIAYYVYQEMTYSLITIVLLLLFSLLVLMDVWRQGFFIITAIFVFSSFFLAKESNLRLEKEKRN